MNFWLLFVKVVSLVFIVFFSRRAVWLSVVYFLFMMLYDCNLFIGIYCLGFCEKLNNSDG